MSILDGLRANLNGILGVRDTLGIALKPVHLVKRTWSGSESGDGVCTETMARMLPSPRIVMFQHDQRVVPGGAIESKDIMLKMVSTQTYPTRDLVDGTSSARNIESLYDVGGLLYRVISIQEKHLTYNILLRQLTDQTRY